MVYTLGYRLYIYIYNYMYTLIGTWLQHFLWVPLERFLLAPQGLTLNPHSLHSIQSTKSRSTKSSASLTTATGGRRWHVRCPEESEKLVVWRHREKQKERNVKGYHGDRMGLIYQWYIPWYGNVSRKYRLSERVISAHLPSPRCGIRRQPFTHFCYGRSPCYIGKPTLNHPLSIAMLVHQR